MSPELREFFSLPRRRQLSLLKSAARTALDEHAIEGASIRLHSWETNVLYRVVSSSGGRFVLRLASPGWRSRENLVSEVLWLEALAKEPSIHAPVAYRTARGECIATVRIEDSPLEWHATLMSYQPGRLLGQYLTAKNVERMGRLFAGLHLQAGSWEPPREFSRQVFDGYLSRGEPNCIFDGCAEMSIDGSDVELLERISETVDREYTILDRSDLRVIHCDLWHDNIKLLRGDLYPFDFEDTILGFRLHDIAMAMLDLLDDVGPERYPPLLEAFHRGYEELLEWPEGNMEVLQAGRILWTINYVARRSPKHLSGAIANRRPFLEAVR